MSSWLIIWWRRRFDARCGQCEQPLVFLGQFDDSTGFNFADVGAAYMFACPQHPDQTLVDCQTH